MLPQFIFFCIYFFIKLANILIMLSKQQRNDESIDRNAIDYIKVNAYSQPFSAQQIITIGLFLLELILHSVFITSAIALQDSSILWVMLAATYIIFIIIITDYVYLTCSDPVDDLILGVNKGYKQSQITYCKEGCDTPVHKSSYHCHTCKRCVQKFDHHCKYLNNCIGGKNYRSFFRLLVMVTVFCIFIIGSAIWIFAFAANDESYDSKIVSRWGVIATLIYTIVMLVSVDTLLCFHCYLIFKVKKTTLQYLDERTDDNVNSSKQVIQK